MKCSAVEHGRRPAGPSAGPPQLHQLYGDLALKLAGTFDGPTMSAWCCAEATEGNRTEQAYPSAGVNGIWYEGALANASGTHSMPYDLPHAQVVWRQVTLCLAPSMHRAQEHDADTEL